MTRPRADGLTLLIWHPGRRFSWNLDFASLRPLVSGVLVVEGGSGAYLVPLLDKALPGAEISHLSLNQSGSAAEWGHQLHERLDGHDSWVLLLRAGANASAHRRFKLPDRAVPQSVIHQSPSGDEAYWAPALVPGLPEYFSVTASGRVVVNAEFSADACQEGVSIRNSESFRPTKKTPALNLETALNDYRDNADPAGAFEIAECHFRLEKLREAEFWYKLYASQGHDDEKKWASLYRLACCLALQENPWPQVEAAMTEAFDANPDRAEPLYHLARHYLEASRYGQSFDLAAIGLEIGTPKTRLPFEIDIYRHRLPLTYMAAAVELRRDRECIRTANRVLREPGVPERVRVEAAGYRSSSVARVHPYYPLSIRRKNRIVVVTPFRNAGGFLGPCADSLSAQNYANCRFILIDDASDDGALDALDIRDSRFTIIRNETRLGTIRNQLDAINEHCEPGDIVVYVDGDDRILDENALSYVNDFFNSTRCWIMYGQYRDSRSRYGRCEPITNQTGPVLEAIGDMHFPMHIRAHRAGLVHHLQNADPKLKRLRDNDGEFLDTVADMALMRALMQLAGLEHIRYNDRILYEYNARNPESHYRAFERMRLQDRQSRLVQSKPPLRPVASYLPSDTRSKTRTDAKTRLLFIALDGMTPRLVHRWAAEGLLPNLKKILDSGQVRDIVVPKGFGNDAFWNSLVTGMSPDEHGYYYRNFWRSDEYKLSFYDLDNELGGEPFWGELSDSNMELAVIDIPEVKHAGRINGLEVTEWMTHARLLPARFVPSELKDNWTGRFGTDPTRGNTETMRPRNARQFTALRDQLLATVEQKTRASLHYLDRGGWDLFAVAYTQGHDVGHQFWHVHDPAHPSHRPAWLQRYGDPLLQTYQGIDQSVGRLIERAGSGARVMIVTGVAMEAKVSCNAVLDDILWKIEKAEYSPQREGMSRKDRRLRRFFAVPHNNLSGAIRLNLKGREAEGLIAPGAEYRQMLDEIENRLRRIVNADTGESVVDECVRIQEVYRGTRVQALPDLFVLWNRRSPINRIHSPWFEKMTVHARGVTDTRSGDHVCHAEMIANFRPPFAGEGPIPVQDIASGLLELLKSFPRGGENF